MTESPHAPKHLIKLLPEKKAFFCGEQQRVLDAALASGQGLPYSCRGGNCGRCAGRVLSGAYRYDRETPPPGLTAEHRQQGMALLCQIVPDGPMTIEVTKSSAAGSQVVTKLPCRIVARHAVAPDVMKLIVQLPRTQPMDFRPGQYIDVLMDRGRRRSYSLANRPYSLASKASVAPDELKTDGGQVGATQLELHVRRVEGGAFSTIAFEPDRASSLLRIEGPLGTFGWREHAGPSLLIAGGTGYAPMKSMLLAAMNKADHPPVHLFWGARSQDDLYEHDELEYWQRSTDWFSFTPVVRDVTGGPGDGERVYERALSEYADLTDWMIYASGPPGLVRRVVEACAKRGIHEDRLAVDSFDYAAE